MMRSFWGAKLFCILDLLYCWSSCTCSLAHEMLTGLFQLFLRSVCERRRRSRSVASLVLVSERDRGEERRSVHLLLQPWKWSCDLTDRPNRQRSTWPFTRRTLAEQGGHLHVPANADLTATAAALIHNMARNLLTFRALFLILRGTETRSQLSQNVYYRISFICSD